MNRYSYPVPRDYSKTDELEEASRRSDENQEEIVLEDVLDMVEVNKKVKK